MNNVAIVDNNGKTVMADGVTIQAQFKQATVTGGVAKLQFEILTENPEAFRIIKKSGKTVLLVVAEQQSIDFDDETGEIYG
jgi:hypothetical protein